MQYVNKIINCSFNIHCCHLHLHTSTNSGSKTYFPLLQMLCSLKRQTCNKFNYWDLALKWWPRKRHQLNQKLSTYDAAHTTENNIPYSVAYLAANMSVIPWHPRVQDMLNSGTKKPPMPFRTIKDSLMSDTFIHIHIHIKQLTDCNITRL